MGLQLCVLTAGHADERGSVLCAPFKRLVEERLQTLPKFRLHLVGDSSWRNHARAMVQSRFTVRSETPSCNAISSNVSPPKKCNSRIFACLGSNSASRV